MPNANDLSAKVREAVEKSVERGQEVAITTIKSLSETASSLLPEVNLPRAAAYMPQAKAAVSSAFTIAEHAVARQREFVLGILDTVEERLGAENVEPAEPASKTKAGAGASA